MHAQIQSLAWELPHAEGAAIKKKKIKNFYSSKDMIKKSQSQRDPLWPSIVTFVAQVQSRAWEHSCAMGAVKKKKKN